MVNTLKDAMNWFLSNSSGGVMCFKDGEKKYCNTFPEAKKFYKGDEK